MPMEEPEVLEITDEEWGALVGAIGSEEGPSVEHGRSPNRKERRDFMRQHAPRAIRLAYGFGLWRSHLLTLDPGWPEAK